MLLLMIALIGALATPAIAEPPAPDRALKKPRGHREKRTYTSPIDGASIDYALWLPPQYDKSKPWPLIVFLHGSQEGKEWRAPTHAGASIPVMESRSDLPFLVAFPLMRGTWSIGSLAERDVLDTIEDVRANFNVDPDRIHLVGISMGGYAAWRYAARYPDMFASMTAFCGGGDPQLAVNLRNLPLRVYHGARDPHVPVELARDMVAALREQKVPVNYEEDRIGDHVIWRDTLADTEFYDYLARQRRLAAPRWISYTTRSLRYHRAYWASIEEMIDPAQPATIDIKYPPTGNRVLITSENVARLRIDPPAVLRSGDKPLTVVVNGKEGTATEDADRGGYEVVIAASAEGGMLKRAGAPCGPILDVMLDPFIVTYGDAGDPHVTEVWKQAAERAVSFGTSLVYARLAPIPASRLTREMIESHNILCFGDALSHPLLAQLADRLPVTIVDERLAAEGKALPADVIAAAFVYPNPIAPGHYLFVATGHAPSTGVLGQAVLTPPFLGTEPLEDLVLLKADGMPFRPGGYTAPEESANLLPTPAPSRGFVFDARWKLTTQDLEWMTGPHETP